MSNEVNGTKPIKKYSQAFKHQAVQLVTEQGLSQAQAARRLGIASTTLHGWVRQLTTDSGQPIDLAIQARLKQLEQENRRLRMEREILKKAATFFASESR